MSDKEHDRQSDVIIASVEQKLDDHIMAFNKVQIDLKEWQKTHEEWCVNAYRGIDKRVEPLETVFRKVEAPVKWVGWLVTGTITGALLYFGNKGAEWMAKHWNP